MDRKLRSMIQRRGRMRMRRKRRRRRRIRKRGAPVLGRVREEGVVDGVLVSEEEGRGGRSAVAGVGE